MADETQDDAEGGRKRAPFHWFEHKSAWQLYEQLDAAFRTETFKRLEVRCDESQKHRPMTFRVVRKGDAALTAFRDGGDVNESHLCPVDCPDD